MASGVSFSGATFEDIINGYDLILSGIEEAGTAALENLSKKGEDLVREQVTTQRNVITGELRDSVGSRMVSDTEAEYGYINPTDATTGQGYAFPVEYGFHHYKSKEWIDGLFALRDSVIVIQTVAQEEINAELSRRIRWVG